MVNLINWLKNALGRSEAGQDQESFGVKPGWVIDIKGTIEKVSKTNIDKSGKNPRHTYFFTLKKEEAICENCDFQLGEEIQFSAKEKQISQCLGREIRKGDRVEIRSVGAERKPRILSVNTIKLLE